MFLHVAEPMMLWLPRRLVLLGLLLIPSPPLFWSPTPPRAARPPLSKTSTLQCLPRNVVVVVVVVYVVVVMVVRTGIGSVVDSMCVTDLCYLGLVATRCL